MRAAWVEEEMQTVDLEDQRLNRRLGEVLSQLAARPTASLPLACSGRAELAAAYRFFANDHVTFEKVLAPHFERAWNRVAAEPVVVLAQDTTEIDVTRPTQQVAGAGPLDHGSRRGALLHATHAFTPDGTPLGTVLADLIVREDEQVGASKLTRAQRAAIPIEQKESYRWVTTLAALHQKAAELKGPRMIAVADSEADIYEYLEAAARAPTNCDWIVRAAQNRALEADVAEESGLLREQLAKQPVLGRQRIPVRGRTAKVACETRGRRQPRESRTTEVEIRSARVTLRPPSRPDRELPALTVQGVLVSEAAPPANDEPIEWLLLTNRPVTTVEEARQVIEYYCARWLIEVFFRVLKSGCRVEERRFEFMDRVETSLAVYLIVAWRTLYVCRIGREFPELSCEALFEPAEWKSAWKVARREDPPATAPPLGTMVELVAQLGGYLKRKKGDHPGPQTIWLGLQRMHDFALCWQMFGPEVQSQERLMSCV